MSALIWKGPSRYTGEPLQAVLVEHSSNTKTGDVAAVWIEPVRKAAAHAAACCGTCPMRNGGCYVDARVIYSVRKNAPRKLEPLPSLKGRVLRLGAHGDPAALPLALVKRLVRSVDGKAVGYTHAWRSRPGLRPFTMASVESPEGAREAWAKGWRTYRVRPKGAPLLAGEIECPAVTHGRTCAQCRLCFGAHPTAPSISIEAHGGAVAAKVAGKVAQP